MTRRRGARLPLVVVSGCSHRWTGVLVAAVLAAAAAASTASVGGRSPAETVYVGRGSPGRLDCPYSADPPATIVVWLKDGRVVDADARMRVTKAGSLLIRAARVGDEGQYACAVYSPSGSTESSPSVQLLVRGKHASCVPSLLL